MCLACLGRLSRGSPTPDGGGQFGPPRPQSAAWPNCFCRIWLAITWQHVVPSPIAFRDNLGERAVICSTRCLAAAGAPPSLFDLAAHHAMQPNISQTTRPASDQARYKVLCDTSASPHRLRSRLLPLAHLDTDNKVSHLGDNTTPQRPLPHATPAHINNGQARNRGRAPRRHAHRAHPLLVARR